MDAWLQIRCSQISSSEDESSAPGGQNCTQRTRRLKMLCSSCLLPLLALYMLPEEASSAALPGRVRNKREMDWMDQELLGHMHDPSDQGDLSVGDAGDMDRDVGRRPPYSETFLAPTEKIQNQNLNQLLRKANDKRRKVVPVDSIGSFQMSSFRNRKDEPDIYWEELEE